MTQFLQKNQQIFSRAVNNEQKYLRKYEWTSSNNTQQQQAEKEWRKSILKVIIVISSSNTGLSRLQSTNSSNLNMISFSVLSLSSLSHTHTLLHRIAREREKWKILFDCKIFTKKYTEESEREREERWENCFCGFPKVLIWLCVRGNGHQTRRERIFFQQILTHWRWRRDAKRRENDSNFKWPLFLVQKKIL